MAKLEFHECNNVRENNIAAKWMKLHRYNHLILIIHKINTKLVEFINVKNKSVI